MSKKDQIFEQYLSKVNHTKINKRNERAVIESNVDDYFYDLKKFDDKKKPNTHSETTKSKSPTSSYLDIYEQVNRKSSVSYNKPVKPTNNNKDYISYLDQMSKPIKDIQIPVVESKKPTKQPVNEKIKTTDTPSSKKIKPEVKNKPKKNPYTEVLEIFDTPIGDDVVSKNEETKNPNHENNLNRLTEQVSKRLRDEILRETKTYVDKSGYGTGTVAKQFADGGTMNGSLVVNGSVTANSFIGTTSADVETLSAGTYEITESNDIILLCDCSAGNIQINIPSATTFNFTITIKKVDETSNTVLLSSFNTETIDNNSNINITEGYTAYKLINNNANWWII